MFTHELNVIQNSCVYHSLSGKSPVIHVVLVSVSIIPMINKEMNSSFLW